MEKNSEYPGAWAKDFPCAWPIIRPPRPAFVDALNWIAGNEPIAYNVDFNPAKRCYVVDIVVKNMVGVATNFEIYAAEIERLGLNYIANQIVDRVTALVELKRAVVIERQVAEAAEFFAVENPFA